MIKLDANIINLIGSSVGSEVEISSHDGLMVATSVSDNFLMKSVLITEVSYSGPSFSLSKKVFKDISESVILTVGESEVTFNIGGDKINFGYNPVNRVEEEDEERIEKTELDHEFEDLLSNLETSSKTGALSQTMVVKFGKDSRLVSGVEYNLVRGTGLPEMTIPSIALNNVKRLVSMGFKSEDIIKVGVGKKVEFHRIGDNYTFVLKIDNIDYTIVPEPDIDFQGGFAVNEDQIDQLIVKMNRLSIPAQFVETMPVRISHGDGVNFSVYSIGNIKSETEMDLSFTPFDAVSTSLPALINALQKRHEPVIDIAPSGIRIIDESNPNFITYLATFE